MIRDRLLLQQRELAKKLQEEYIERSVAFPPGEGLIKVLIGPRRAGKSTFAVHCLQQQGGSFGYCNFDDEELVTVSDYQEIITEIEDIYQKPAALLLDEIQNLPRWELFVNRLQRQGYQLVVTGSNANLLSRELATHLTGRHQQIVVFPFSFHEFIQRKKKQLISYEIQQELQKYLQQGGFPEQVVKNIEGREYLSTLYDNILYKDIVKRWNIRSVQAIDRLTQCLFSSAASELSYNTLRKLTGIKSIIALQKYLHALEEAFLFFYVQRFSFKAKERITTPKKVYGIDTGMIQAKTVSFSSNTGKLYENIVAIELKKLEIQGKCQFFYWKSKKDEEVDFVIKEGQNVTQLIQVCMDVGSEKTKMREVRALLKAGSELNCKDLLILTKDQEGTENAEWFGLHGGIVYLPLWKWLLDENKKK